ncbi:13186_t:CDS:2, partial [Racocetra fulgida]
IVEAWNNIPADMIINSFEKCGIPHSIERELEDEQMIIPVEDRENYLIVYIENLKYMPEYYCGCKGSEFVDQKDKSAKRYENEIENVNVNSSGYCNLKMKDRMKIVNKPKSLNEEMPGINNCSEQVHKIVVNEKEMAIVNLKNSDGCMDLRDHDQLKPVINL